MVELRGCSSAKAAVCRCTPGAPAIAQPFLPPDAKSSRNPLQTKGISRSTSDRYRTTSQATLPQQGPRRQLQTWKRASNTGPAKGLGSLATAPSAQAYPVHSPTLSAHLQPAIQRSILPLQLRAGELRPFGGFRPGLQPGQQELDVAQGRIDRFLDGSPRRQQIWIRRGATAVS